MTNFFSLSAYFMISSDCEVCEMQPSRYALELEASWSNEKETGIA